MGVQAVEIEFDTDDMVIKECLQSNICRFISCEEIERAVKAVLRNCQPL
ncbi:hypothetical protein [Fonticella tunisiensis]|nr:hypothetical protein [Fonticella tunisiensis]